MFSNSPKKRTNEFVFTTMTNSFVSFLGEFEGTKKSFRNYLTFKNLQNAHVHGLLLMTELHESQSFLFIDIGRIGIAQN